MKKHEQLEKYLDDLRDAKGNFYGTGRGAPYFIGTVIGLISNAEYDGKRTIKIDDILKAMKKACEYALEQKEKQ